MILRKPYAFLIKHFKLIHLILVVLLCINLYYSLGVVNFFNAYIANGYRATSTFNLIETYTPIIFLISIIASIVIPLTLYILLSYKQKPNMIYMNMIIYYVILLVLFIYARGVFNTLSNEVISSTLSRVIRDISIINLIPQIPFIIVILIRSIGFNLKKFAFESDFKDMQLDFSDNEEVEVDVSFNGYKFKRKLRKELREFKYYLIENKFVVSIILIIVLVIIGFSIYNTARPSYEKHFKIGQTFIYKDFDIVINDSILTSLDYKGQTINPGKYYILLNISVSNNQKVAKNFDFNSLKLKIKDKLISPTQSLISYFEDVGNIDVNEYILSKETKNYVVCFEMDSGSIQKDYQVVLSNGSAEFRGETYNKSIIINIYPTVMNYQKVKNYKINDVITFEDDFLKDNTIQVSYYTISKSVRYNYDVCDNDKCKEYTDIVTVSALNSRADNFLLKLNGTYVNNNNNDRYDSMNYLFNKLCLIEYVVDDERKLFKAIDVTPNNYTEGVILEVPGEVRDASSINVIISTRAYQYSMSIK